MPSGNVSDGAVPWVRGLAQVPSCRATELLPDDEDVPEVEPVEVPAVVDGAASVEEVVAGGGGVVVVVDVVEGVVVVVEDVVGNVDEVFDVVVASTALLVVVATIGAYASFAFSATALVVSAVGVTIESSVTVVAIVARGRPSFPTVTVSHTTTFGLS